MLGLVGGLALHLKLEPGGDIDRLALHARGWTIVRRAAESDRRTYLWLLTAAEEHIIDGAGFRVGDH